MEAPGNVTEGLSESKGEMCSVHVRLISGERFLITMPSSETLERVRQRHKNQSLQNGTLSHRIDRRVSEKKRGESFPLNMQRLVLADEGESYLDETETLSQVGIPVGSTLQFVMDKTDVALENQVSTVANELEFMPDSDNFKTEEPDRLLAGVTDVLVVITSY